MNNLPQLKSILEPILIIGGGAAGSGAARALARAGYEQITLLEAREELFSATSIMTPGRSGHGFHYIDLPTGIMYQEATIEFNQEFPGLRIGEDQPESHPIRKGRYFIVPEAENLFPIQQILGTYEALHQHYQQLVQQDQKNQVLGDPNDFFRILDPQEYQDKVNLSRVAVGIETTEQLLDCARFKTQLLAELAQYPGLNILTQQKVTHIEYGTQHRFKVMTEQGVEYSANTVINATWYHINYLDNQLGLYDPANVITHRLKAIAKIKLPPGYENEHSMFFCMGPHCMFSNIGGGFGLITSAKHTNIAISTDLTLNETMQRLLNGGATTDEIHHYGQQIIQGVTEYIPWIKDAELITVNFGIVSSKGEVDIFDPRSAFHRRNYSGVEPRHLGYIANASMKLLFLHQNGKIVLEELTKHGRALIQCEHFIQKICSQSTLPKQIKQSLQQPLLQALSQLCLPEDWDDNDG